MSYFTVFTDYGFALSATRAISIHRLNQTKLSEIFSAVLTTKLCLCVVSFLILFFLVHFFPRFEREQQLYYLSFALVFGQVLFPVWFFQGIEQMKFITILSAFARICSTVLIFVFVKSTPDYIYVNVFHGLGSFVTSIAAISIVGTKFSVRKSSVPTKVILRELTEGWHLFISNFTVNIYTNTNLLILGFFANAQSVGYYSLSDKIVTMIRQLLVVFSQAVYPRICSLAQETHQRLVAFVKSVFIPFAVFIFASCIAVFLFADYLVILATGHFDKNISTIVKLLSVVPLIVLLNIPAYQILLAYNFKKSYSTILVSGAFLNITLNILLSSKFAAYGTAFAVILTELFITVGLYTVLQLKHPNQSLFSNTFN
jgi:PST family polysaccharide transporter